jgi:thiol-disulfide isomerase/thioredoxin
MAGKHFVVLILVVSIIGFCMVQGCGRGEPGGNPYVGNMDDLSYSGQVYDSSCVQRLNALGDEVCVADFEGRFVWADYAAPWCKPCRAQAPAIKALEHKLEDRVVFLTVITSASVEFQSTPTQQTAKDWARQFKLDPAKVVVATDRWGMTIPTHILFSPTGQTLYRSKGYLSKGRIRAILAEHIRNWQNWSEEDTATE